MVLSDLNHLPLYGRANVFVGEKEERMMITGLHTVADIFCVGCGSIVGWKYVRLEGKDSKRIRCVFECFLLRLVNWMVSFRRLHMKGVRSTRKENLCLSGQWITTFGESSNSGLK